MSSGPEIMENRRLGRYTLLEHLGRGGMAVVYRATDNETGSIVAVKIFQSGPERPPEMSARLRDREVRMLMSVQHPNIVKFRDAGQEGDDYFFAMEFVENSLLKCMRRGAPFELVDTVLILRQTVSALAAIHHQGIVHRDIKPGNILLDQNPNSTAHAKLTDLGIAKNVSETDIVREQMPTRVPGTPKYLSPEQIRLQAVDGRADIFSLGVVAYELLTGTTPFKADSTEAYLKANVEQAHLPVLEVDGSVPKYLSDMVDRMLAKDREERYDSDTLARDLELVQQHLISEAPMVERTNPASMFYEPPARTGRRFVAAARRPAIAPVSWALALALALVGLVTSLALWPGDERLPAPAGGATPPTPDAAARLRQAEEALADGQHWRAMSSLRALEADDLPAEMQDRARRLAEQAQEVVAEPYRAATAGLLARGRSDEAEIALRRMEDFVPSARATAVLAAAVRRRRAAPLEQDGWQAALRETHALVRSRHYTEALEARRALFAAAGEDAARVRAVRRAVGDLFDHWAHYLLGIYPDADGVEKFFATLAQSSDILTGGPSAAVLGELHIKLARIYRDKGMHEQALAQYEAVALGGPPDLAAEAGQARDELRRWLASRPHEAEAFARELAQNGFGSSVWAARDEGGATQRVADGVLVLDAPAGAPNPSARRETARTVRNLGFACSVEFRPSPALLARPGTARLGIAAISDGQDAFELAFDGRSYAATVRRGASQSAAGGALCEPVGDEDRSWHVLGLAYDYDTGQLTALLDGRELRRYTVNLSDIRLRVFLEAGGGAGARASFRSVSFQPPGASAP